MSTRQKTSRPSVGDILDVPGYGRCEVTSTSDPSLIVLGTAEGVTFKIGEKALHLALLAAERDAKRARTFYEKRHGAVVEQIGLALVG